MGVSGHCFCTATLALTAKDWLGSTAQALTFYGGVPQLIVPDNARAYHPQDKPKIELSVLLAQRWIQARLRKYQFSSVQEVNTAIAPLLQWLKQRACQKLPRSRARMVTRLPRRCAGLASDTDVFQHLPVVGTVRVEGDVAHLPATHWARRREHRMGSCDQNHPQPVCR